LVSKKNRKKQEQQDFFFPNFGNLTEGKISGTLGIPVFWGGKKRRKSGNKKKCAKKIWKFGTKRPSMRTALHLEI